MKKNTNLLPIIVIAAVLAIVIIAAVILFATNVVVGGHLYPKSAEFLNLRDQEVTVEEYKQLSKKLPKCDIYWNVPLSSGKFPENSQILKISSLTEDDIDAIACFEDLVLVEAENCTDYAQLQQLQDRYSHLAVHYTVNISGTEYPYDATQVELSSLTDEDISRMQYLPNLQFVQAGQCSDYTKVDALKAAYPHLTIATTVTIAGQEFDGETTELTVTGFAEADITYLKYLPKLQRVHLVNPKLSGEQLQSLAAQLPNASLSWDVTIGGQTFRSDVTEVEIVGADIDAQELKSALVSLPNLEMVFLNECNVDNDAMAALRDEVRADYKLVWTVQCGSITVRTDATYFHPIQQYVWYFFDEDAANLVYCEDMICVDLGHMSIHHVEWLKGMPKLKYLILAHTQIANLNGIENCKELVFLEVDWSPVKDLSAVKGCTALEDINIGNTYADITPLTEMPWLRNVYCVGRGEATAAALNRALAEGGTTVFYQAEHTVGGNWRRLPNYYAMRDVLGMSYMA